MNDLRIKENELFERWKAHASADKNTFFVQDGALDNGAYVNSKLKICSILKEVPFDSTAETGYHFGDGFLDKLKILGPKNYEKGKGTLTVLAKRIKLIREVLFEENQNDLTGGLKESAYINIKKYKGEKKSSVKDLEKVAIQDKDFLLEQIETILQPDILLCGKTRHYLGFLYGGDIKFLMENESKRIKLFHLIVEGNPKRLIIEMYHPSHRGSEIELLSELQRLLIKYQNSDINIFKK